MEWPVLLQFSNTKRSTKDFKSVLLFEISFFVTSKSVRILDFRNGPLVAY